MAAWSHNDTLMQFQADVLACRSSGRRWRRRRLSARPMPPVWQSASGRAKTTSGRIRAMDKTWEPDPNSKASTENYRM